MESFQKTTVKLFTVVTARKKSHNLSLTEWNHSLPIKVDSDWSFDSVLSLKTIYFFTLHPHVKTRSIKSWANALSLTVLHCFFGESTFSYCTLKQWNSLSFDIHMHSVLILPCFQLNGTPLNSPLLTNTIQQVISNQVLSSWLLPCVQQEIQHYVYILLLRFYAFKFFVIS